MLTTRLVCVWSLLVGVASAQTVGTHATFENIGLEVAFASPPAAGTIITTAVKKASSPGDYRQAHPLSRVRSNLFAGSILQLAAGTEYAIRLSSPAFAADIFTSVTTRSDAFPAATGLVYHVATNGSDANGGLSPADAFRTLGHALSVVSAGRTILLHNGRYYEGGYDISVDGTASNPIVIASAPGERAILDGTDTNFIPSWVLHDAGAAVYRTASTRQPWSAFMNGEQLYNYGSYDDLRTNRWGQYLGYHADGSHVYVRFPGGGAPGTNVVTIPAHGTCLTFSQGHRFQIRDLEFCHFGYDEYHRAIYLYQSDGHLIENCDFHHNGIGVAIKYDSDDNTIQHCTFSESPVDTWSWSAIKEGSAGYEAGGVVVYGSGQTNDGNVIRRNRFEHMFDGAHLYSETAGGPTKNMDFHDNMLVLCGDDGIETDGYGSNNRIYRNTFRGFLTGISVAPCAVGPTYVFRNVLADWDSVAGYEGYPFKFNHGYAISIDWLYLYHNTCCTEASGQDGFLFKNYSRWTNIVSRNNIYAGTDHALESWSGVNPVDFDYDDLYTTHATHFVSWAGSAYGTLAAFFAATGQEGQGLSVVPRFVDAANGDYELESDSALIDHGLAIPGINDEYVGGGPDIGAFEFVQHSAGAGVSGGDAVTRWHAVSGTVYQLQFSADLVVGVWTNVGEASAATNALISLRDTNAAPMRCYRLVLP